MKYSKFVIEGYRAISDSLEINVEKKSLLPIIGINESGKTTILHAIFALDYYNDTLNDGGRHLKDTANLYRTSPPPATVAAEVRLSREEFKDVLTKLPGQDVHAKDIRRYRRKDFPIGPTTAIVRDIKSGKYDLDGAQFTSKTLNHAVARAIIARLPYILFFDDFRDSVEERIEIVKDEDGRTSGWLAIFEQLFKQTDASFSVFELPTLEERNRKSVLARVMRHLNDTLTREWQNFKLDEDVADALRISIDYQEIPGTPDTTRSFLKLEIIERDARGNDHYFFIRDRSKGFFWFFNFVMKLEFNPKLAGEESGSIYLLDEPGSYLHTAAQRKLCSKLRQLSASNRVIYCTHSHYLLDPEVIPLASIRVAHKDGNGSVGLIPIHEYPDTAGDRQWAFQPVLDALQIKPFLMDLTHDFVVIVEGQYDHYALEMLKGSRDIKILPAVGADTIQTYVSFLIAWQARFRALWDNDKAERTARDRAAKAFGEEVAERHFFLLPKKDASQKDRILQDLFAGSDLRMAKQELGLPTNSSFEKTLASMYYDPRRASVLASLSEQTTRNFEELFAQLGL